MHRNPTRSLAAAQSEERVRSALSKLSADQMRVVELSFFEEKAHAEIAQMLEFRWVRSNHGCAWP